MKLQISDNAACSLAGLAIAARLVHGVVVDLPELLNAGWLAILLGGAIAAIPALALCALLKQRRSASVLACIAHPLRRVTCAAFFALSACDAAVVSSAIADSASIMALTDVATVYLMLPLLAICLACLRLNGDALGRSAAIWNRALPWLLLLVIVLEFRDYRFNWLTPVLGPGVSTLLDGAVRAAGWLSLPAALFLTAVPDERNVHSHLLPLKALGTSAGFAVLVALMYGMMTPAIQDSSLFSRSFRLDTLLANGRTGLSLQLPTNVLWYVSLLYALLFDVFTSAAMLQGALPRFGNRTCTVLALFAISLLSVSRLSGRAPGLRAAVWLFPCIGLLLSILMISVFFAKGARKHA